MKSTTYCRRRKCVVRPEYCAFAAFPADLSNIASPDCFKAINEKYKHD
jgi:hypothetical protein